MVENKEDLIMEWLKNAYAMETGIAKTLEEHLEDAKGYPEVKDKIQEHLEVTKWQAERVKERIEELGEDTSKIREGVAKVIGKMAGWQTEMAEDKVIKNAIAEAGTERMEITSYEGLIEAANEIGDEETAELCEEIKEEEMEMEIWLEDNFPALVKTYMKKEVGAEA